jgi:ribosomal protein S6--L-glutamate ligase
MRLAILTAADSWYLNDLRRAAAGDHEIVAVSFRELTAYVAVTENHITASERSLADMDAALVRTMPPGSLEQVVFRMDALARLEANGVRVINPPKAIEAAVDKYLTTARLAAAGLPVPRTLVCESPDAALAAFHSLGGDVVLKPIFGSEGRGIARLQDEAIAARTFRTLAAIGSVLYLQEFIPHEGFDLRVLVIGERLFAIRRCNPNDWRTNVSRGAKAEPLELSPEIADLALRSAAAVGAPLAGVDLLTSRDGRLLVIEVNAVPGWRALSAALNIDVARHVLNFLARNTR